MKYFLVFALVAVAGAVSPVRLMEPVLFEEAIYAPQEFNEVPMPVKVVDAPEIAEGAVEDVNAHAVKVVDEAVNAGTVADLKSLLKPVQLEEAVYSPLSIPEEVKDAVMAVKVVEAPEVSEAAEDTNAYAVKIVEEAVNDVEAPVIVNLIRAPLPDSVVLPFVGTVVLPSIKPAMVNVVDIDEESPSYNPLRMYPDPTWR